MQGQQEDDSALVAGCRRGDTHALSLLVERHQASVFGVALRLCRDRESALEVTNSVFFKAYQNLNTFDESRPLRPWLLRIATNEALNLLRSRRREREHVIDSVSSEGVFERLADDTDLESATVASERREAVRQALARLPAKYRTVLTLRFVNDLSYQEIADIVGQDANAVGVQLLRGRQLLRAALAESRARNTL